MRNKWIGLALVMIAALLAVAGTIFAQDEDTDTAAERGWLGVAIVENGDQLVVAEVVSGSPADAADVRVGDVIVAVNGTAVSGAQELGDLIAEAGAGSEVSLDLLRGEQTVNVTATLTASPQALRFEARQNPLTMLERVLNADLEEADNAYLVVDTLTINNPFALADGDLITAINGLPVDDDLTMTAIRDSLNALDEPALTLTVSRDGEEIRLESDRFNMMMRGMGFGFRDGGRGQDFRFEGVPFDRMPFEGMPFGFRDGEGRFEFRFFPDGEGGPFFEGMPFDFDFDRLPRGPFHMMPDDQAAPEAPPEEDAPQGDEAAVGGLA